MDCEGLDPVLYIRKDVASRKVFYMRGDNMQEYHLFNFNLNVNDVIDVPLGMYEPSRIEYRMISIDTINLPDGKHKRFKYCKTGGMQHRTFTLIEGIGCTEEPFKVYHSTPDPVFYLLNSYKVNQCQYKFKDTCPPNPCTTLTNIAKTTTKSIKVWPNPCDDALQLDSDLSYHYALGQIIQTGNCQSKIDMSARAQVLYELVLGHYGEKAKLRVIRE